VWTADTPEFARTCSGISLGRFPDGGPQHRRRGRNPLENRTKKGEGQIQASRRPFGPILIVEDDPEVLASTAGIFERAGYRTVLAADGEAALDLAALEPPCLAVLDICLPGISGYQVCRALREQFGDGLPIVFVSGARTESYDRVAGLLIGGDDYFSKPLCPDEFAIRMERLIRRSAPLNPAVSLALTARELDVLRLLAEGLSPAEVSERLVIMNKTVATHIDHILRKLGVHSRAQAVAMAYRRDLLEAH
jgi:DNA-binding NarL/FixJ family response regulator